MNKFDDEYMSKTNQLNRELAGYFGENKVQEFYDIVGDAELDFDGWRIYIRYPDSGLEYYIKSDNGKYELHTINHQGMDFTVGSSGHWRGVDWFFNMLRDKLPSSIKSSKQYNVITPDGMTVGTLRSYEDACDLAEEVDGKVVPVESSRKITSANNYGWIVDSSEAMDALDLFVEYFGEDTALEELAKALGDNELKENLEWICRQWGFLEEIEDLDTWEQFETAKEYMGVSELLTNLSQAMGYDELSECLAFIVRMYDFREWKSKYDEDEDEEDDEIESSRKAVKSSADNLPSEVYYMVVQGAKMYYSTDYDKVADMVQKINNEPGPRVYGPYTETDPEEIQELYEVGYLSNSRKSIKSSADTIHCVYVSDITPAEWNKQMALAAIRNSVTNYGYYDYNGKKGCCIVGDFEDIYNFIESIGHVVDENYIYHWKQFDWDSAEKLDKSANSSRQIKSNLMEGADAGRYVVTNPSDGTVLGSADTYEEAVENFGDNVTITDSEATKEDDNLFDNNVTSKKMSNHDFLQNIISRVLTKEMSEDEAVKEIASRNDVNTGFAKRIFNNLMEDRTLVTSGVMEIADDLNKEFDLNGSLESWFEDYVSDEGKSTTIGGELVRAASKIIERWNNEGAMIGKDKEELNPPARYIVSIATDYPRTSEIEQMLEDKKSTLNSNKDEYSAWIELFRNSFEDYLREHEEFFHSPNKNDMYDYGEEDDVDEYISECYIEDDDGNKYFFMKQDDGKWRCSNVDFGYNSPTWDMTDIISADDIEQYADVDEGDDFIDFLGGDGYEYSAEKDEDGDWYVSDVRLEDPLADEGDEWDVSDFEGYTVFDTFDNEISSDDLM